MAFPKVRRVRRQVPEFSIKKWSGNKAMATVCGIELFTWGSFGFSGTQSIDYK